MIPINSNIMKYHDIFLKGSRASVTVSIRARIGEHIADAYIIAATSQAGEWYGVDDPNFLLGSWLSNISHPDDAIIGRILALARHHGIETPESYVSRLHQIHVRRFIPVSKHVTQVVIDGETYFITEFSPAKEVPLALNQELLNQFLLPNINLPTDFLGSMSVAEMERVLHNIGSTQVPKLQYRDIETTPGGTLCINMSTYVHQCARCLNIWFTSDRDPDRCGKRECQQFNWRTVPRSYKRNKTKGDSKSAADMGADVFPVASYQDIEHEALTDPTEVSIHGPHWTRTNADKRRAVELMLHVGSLARLSDRELSKLAGVDHKTVGRVRKVLEQSGEIPHRDETTVAETWPDLVIEN